PGDWVYVVVERSAKKGEGLSPAPLSRGLLLGEDLDLAGDDFIRLHLAAVGGVLAAAELPFHLHVRALLDGADRLGEFAPSRDLVPFRELLPLFAFAPEGGRGHVEIQNRLAALEGLAGRCGSYEALHGHGVDVDVVRHRRFYPFLPVSRAPKE